jgi:hypothetical protein
MKNLLDSQTVESLVQRVHQLGPDTKPQWGSMTATEMLLHCNKIHQQLLSPSTTQKKKKTSLKQYAVRWVVLYIMPHFPKGAQAPKQMHTKGTITNADFEAQKQQFIEIVRRFPEHTAPIAHRHPYFGNLNTKQWGRAGWKHVDHHLRQFGV